MLTYRDLQREFRAGLDAARRAGAREFFDVWRIERQFACPIGTPRDWAERDACAAAYNAGLHAAIGDRSHALVFWGNAIFHGRPDGFVRRERKGVAR